VPACACIETTLNHTNGSFVGIHRSCRALPTGWWVALALLCLLAQPALADGLHVALLPDSTMNVAAGDTVPIQLCVTEAGAAFNAYAVVVDFDTTALAFLPTSPTSLQEGALMKGACGSTFHVFKAAGDTLSVSHSLMCAGISLTGPGELYRLRFRAREVVGGTWVRIRHVQFYDAGPPVEPVQTTDAFVLIGGAVGVADPSGAASALSLTALPNPCRSGTTFLVGSDRAGEQRLEIFDVVGRTVRVLARGDFPAGRRRVTWDGADGTGRRVPPGVYPVVFTAAGRARQARVAVVR